MSRMQLRITWSLILLCGLVVGFVIIVNPGGWKVERGVVFALLGIIIWTTPFLLKWILNGRKKDKELGPRKD